MNTLEKASLKFRTDLFIENKPNNKSCKTFIVRSWYTFYFKQHFKVSFKFSSVFVTLFFSQFNGLFSSIKMNFCRDFQSLFTCMVDMFLSSKDIQSAMRQ